MRNVREGYVWDGADYHQSSSEQKKWGLELLGRLQLTGSEHVLDIGSGDGWLTAQVAAAVPAGRVVGIDSSADMVAFAGAHFGPERFPNLSFHVADARALTFDAAFDAVFSNATLHWVLDHEPVTAGIARALRKGGRALLQMGGSGNAAAIVAAMTSMTERERWKGYFEGFTFPYGFHGPDRYAPWLEKAGLRALRLELLEKDMVHGGSEGLKAWLRTTWLPYLQRLPEALRGDFIDEVVDLYLVRHAPDDEGRTHVRMVRLEVEAVRG
jgi:trans-aconitate methyltransferase